MARKKADTRPTSYFSQRGVRFPIKWKPRLKDDGKRIAGLNEEGVISINTDLDPRDYARILFHELVHEARKTPVQASLADDLDEVATLTTEWNLISMWQRNPELFAWLHREITGRKP